LTNDCDGPAMDPCRLARAGRSFGRAVLAGAIHAACERGAWPLASMRSADRRPIMRPRSKLADHRRRCRPRSDRSAITPPCPRSSLP
jgi:hypothetical protein